MDWKEKFWRALGATTLEDSPWRRVVWFSDFTVSKESTVGNAGRVDFLDPHDPVVPLEVLFKGFQKKLGDN